MSKKKSKSTLFSAAKRETLARHRPMFLRSHFFWLPRDLIVNCPSCNFINFFSVTVIAGNEKVMNKIAADLARLVCRHFEVDIESSGSFEVLEAVEPGRLHREAMQTDR
jgi:hypothetical protein